MTTNTPVAKTGSMLFWPIALTALVLAARLVGELLDGPELLFGKAAGGGFALVSITYLVPLFGAYYGWRLTGMRDAPDRPGIALGLSLFGGVVAIAGVALSIGVLELPYPTFIYVIAGSALLSLLICWRAWPGLFRKLFVYALAVRLLVVAVTVAALALDLDTHFTALPSDAEGVEMPLLQRGVSLCTPQLLFWIPFTTSLGGIFGAMASMLRGRRRDDRIDD